MLKRRHTYHMLPNIARNVSGIVVEMKVIQLNCHRDGHISRARVSVSFVAIEEDFEQAFVCTSTISGT